MNARVLAVGVGLACASLPLSACAEVESAAVDGYHPTKLHEVKGSELPRVTFTKEGARRADLQTAQVTRRGARDVVPYEALIYDADGGTWVYTATDALSFHRTKVVVDHIKGDRVVLTDGPRPGTPVVTVGAAEVYGAELEIAGDH